MNGPSRDRGEDPAGSDRGGFPAGWRLAGICGAMARRTDTMSLPYSPAICRVLNGGTAEGEHATHDALFAALDQAPKLETDPGARGQSLEIAEGGLVLHDVGVEGPDVIAELVEELGLGDKVLVLGVEAVELFLGGVGLCAEAAAAALELVEGFLAGADGLELLAHVVAVGGILGEGRGEVGEDGGGGGEDVLRRG